MLPGLAVTTGGLAYAATSQRVKPKRAGWGARGCVAGSWTSGLRWLTPGVSLRAVRLSLRRSRGG